MTPAGFRRIALALGGVVEREHHRHPDFRANGRIFATLGYPDKKHGMVVLTPQQQRDCAAIHPDVFEPVNGKWGEKGCTLVHLAVADAESVGEALTLAWRGTQGPTDIRNRGADQRKARRTTTDKR